MVDFLIVGAQKAGSSSLHRYLNLHPDISMTRTKEVNFFLNKNFPKGETWYKSKFYKDKNLYGDCSPSYSRLHLYPEVINNLRSFDRPLKIIYILRNPIDRIISHLIHDQVTDRIPHDFNVLNLLKYNKDYILTSSYFFQISPFIELYGKENIYYTTLENFKLNASNELNNIFSFLNLKPINLLDNNFKKFNSSSSKRRIKFYTYIYKKLNYKIIKEPWFRFFQNYGAKIKSPQLNNEEIKYIIKKLAKDYEKFDFEFRSNISEWLKV